jgi:type IV pilus assembly protein PilE
MKLNKAPRRTSAGFTLVELMVVVVIASVLASIAVPSYRDYVTRGKIPDATAALATRRVQMEQFFQDNKTYAGAPPCAAVDTTTSKNFRFDCETAPTATAFKLRASGVGTMAGFIYTVDQSNTKATTAPAGWASSTSCWVTSKAGPC